MKIIRNNIIPPKGFIAINLFGILFVRKDAEITQKVIRHESIHSAQQRELLYIPFYILYVLEWFIKVFIYDNAYRNISFEREAYNNENDYYYLNNRKWYSWIKYIFKNG